MATILFILQTFQPGSLVRFPRFTGLGSSHPFLDLFVYVLENLFSAPRRQAKIVYVFLFFHILHS